MESFYITGGNRDSLMTALGELAEYAYFLAGEHGSKERQNFVLEIFKRNEIQYEIQSCEE